MKYAAYATDFGHLLEHFRQFFPRRPHQIFASSSYSSRRFNNHVKVLYITLMDTKIEHPDTRSVTVQSHWSTYDGVVRSSLFCQQFRPNLNVETGPSTLVTKFYRHALYESKKLTWNLGPAQSAILASHSAGAGLLSRITVNSESPTFQIPIFLQKPAPELSPVPLPCSITNIACNSLQIPELLTPQGQRRPCEIAVAICAFPTSTKLRRHDSACGRLTALTPKIITASFSP